MLINILADFNTINVEINLREDHKESQLHLNEGLLMHPVISLIRWERKCPFT
jgi:hypothetical protein